MADPLPDLVPLPFAEAIAWARQRQVVLPEVYYGQLQGLARAQAFTITGLTSLDQLQQVADSLTRVLETGDTFRDWQKRVLAGEIPLEVGTAQMETIFRNNIQQSYNRGRYEQQAANLATHPYYMYDAVNDSRTRPSHAAMDGFTAPADDPVWATWTPACGHRCRCRRVALTERQAARYLEQDQARMTDPEAAAERASAKIHGPDKGWEYNVYQDPNAGLKRAVERRRETANPVLMAAHDAEAARVEQREKAFEAARQDCLAFGKANDRERLIVGDDRTGREIARTDGGPRSVMFTDEVMAIINDEDAAVRLIHNHPGDSPFSSADLFTLVRPGVTAIEAMGGAGSRYMAEAVVKGTGLFGRAFGKADDAVHNTIHPGIGGLRLPLAIANWVHYHIVASALHEAGIIRYEAILTVEKLGAIADHEAIIGKAIDAAKRAVESVK